MNHPDYYRTMAQPFEVTTLLSQLGLDPGITDLPWLPPA